MKNKILHKAGDLFLSRGFKSVTMDEIAKEMGISKKTIYEYFSTKTKLVETTTFNLYQIISNEIDRIYAQNLDPITEMYEIKKFLMRKLKGEKASPIFQLQKYYPEIFQKVRDMQFEKMKTCLKQNLQRGIIQGLYRENLNYEFVSRIYFIGINGIKDNGIFPKSEFSAKEVHEEFLSYHLRGIVTTKGLKKLNKIIENDH